MIWLAFTKNMFIGCTSLYFGMIWLVVSYFNHACHWIILTTYLLDINIFGIATIQGSRRNESGSYVQFWSNYHLTVHIYSIPNIALGLCHRI